MKETQIDINIVINLYNQRILELESQNILLKAEVQQLKKNNIEKETIEE